MLLIIDDYRQLDYGQLMTVYEQSNRQKGTEQYPSCETWEQRLRAEQDLYDYMHDFLKGKRTVFAVWAPEGKYQAALRLEPYRDGMLVTALETAPAARQQGYATLLLQAVLEQYPGVCLYSHIFRCNAASIRVHEKCGFQRTLDYAVFLDGSVSGHAYTYKYEM